MLAMHVLMDNGQLLFILMASQKLLEQSLSEALFSGGLIVLQRPCVHLRVVEGSMGLFVSPLAVSASSTCLASTSGFPSQTCLFLEIGGAFLTFEPLTFPL